MCSSPTGQTRSAIADPWLNANRPPGRSSRAASGTVRYGSAKVIAPWSQKTMSKLASGSGTASALAWTRRTSTPAASTRRRACSSCRSDRSIPTTRPPRFASAIDHWAAPQPNSRMSLPSTSPRIRSSSSGTWNMPQAYPSWVLSWSPWRAWYSSE